MLLPNFIFILENNAIYLQNMNTISCCHTQDPGQLLGIKLPGYWIQLSGSNLLGRTLVMLSFRPPNVVTLLLSIHKLDPQHPSGGV